MSIYRKPAVECEIDGTKIHVKPLGIGVVLALRELKTPLAQAIAKFKPIGIQDFKTVKHTTPKPTEHDPEAIEYIEQTEHTAPNAAAITQAMTNKTQAVEALFDCLFQEQLLGKVFSSSVVEFKGLTHEQLFDEDGDKSMDIPTAMEIMGHIVEANMKGFESLGKSWLPLKNLLGGLGARV
jgi:hypothetical protein